MPNAALEVKMPKNRMTFHDPRDELPPVTIEILKGDVLRFTQVDREGRTNVITFSDRFGVRRGVFDAAQEPAPSPTAEA
ncbi:MAG TPA: hypothetical protein VJM34_03595 [Novosphingobium sp.]|nr:hypothetical protein [Novosphingobium sp.]